MRLHGRLTRFALSMLFSALTASAASATCWICLLDGGSGQFYCQSAVGTEAISCTPNWYAYCTLGEEHYCEEDGCQCARFPALPPEEELAARAPSSVGLLLLHGRDAAAQKNLLAAISESRVSFDIEDAVVTPEIAANALVAIDPRVRADDLELAGYAAATKRGAVTRRLLGENNEGLLIDARVSQLGQHVMLSQLVGGSVAISSREFELAPNRAAVCPVQLGGDSFACVIWARRLDSESKTDAERHNRFIEAADAFPIRHFVAFRADSPEPNSITYQNLPSAKPSAWGRMASYFR